MGVALKPLIHVQLALFLILSGLYGLSPSYTEMKKLYLGLWNTDALAPPAASSSSSFSGAGHRHSSIFAARGDQPAVPRESAPAQGHDAVVSQPDPRSGRGAPVDAARGSPPAVRQGAGAEGEASDEGKGETLYAAAAPAQPDTHRAPARADAHRAPGGRSFQAGPEASGQGTGGETLYGSARAFSPEGHRAPSLAGAHQAAGGHWADGLHPGPGFHAGGLRQRFRKSFRSKMAPGAFPDMSSQASKLSDSERASFFLWADPFSNTTGRPARADEPAFESFLTAVVGPCTVVLATPSRRVMKTSGMIFLEGMRAAADTRMKTCLMEKRGEKPRQSWLFAAVLAGLSSSCGWLKEQGADPLRPFQDSDIAEVLSLSKANFGRRNTWGIFQPQSFTTASAGKNAVQLAIQLGHSDIVKRWASADTVIDERGRTVADYLRSRGSAVFPDEAARDFGLSVERRASESPTLDAAGTLECQDGPVPVQWAGWSRSSTFEPYGKCDMDVVDSLTRAQYLSEYWATGRPVLVRNFIPAEDLCRGTRESMMSYFGDQDFHVGPQAYPAISGTTYCESRFTLKEVEGGAYCDTHPGVSNYQAMKQDGDAMPFRLTSSKTFERIREILAIGEEHLNSKQFFFGGDKSGATLHFHTAAFNLLHVGQKDWFLVPPSHTAFAGIPSYQLWQRAGTDMRHVARCTQQAGDMLLLPEYWGHSTLSHGFSAGLGVLYERQSHRRSR